MTGTDPNPRGAVGMPSPVLTNGIFGQSIYINPKEKVVIAVWSAQLKPTGAAVIKNTDFYDAVVAALH